MEIRESVEVLLLLQMSHGLMIIHILRQPDFPKVCPTPSSSSLKPDFFSIFFIFAFCQTFLPPFPILTSYVNGSSPK